MFVLLAVVSANCKKGGFWDSWEQMPSFKENFNERLIKMKDNIIRTDAKAVALLKELNLDRDLNISKKDLQGKRKRLSSELLGCALHSIMDFCSSYLAIEHFTNLDTSMLRMIVCITVWQNGDIETRVWDDEEGIVLAQTRNVEDNGEKNAIVGDIHWYSDPDSPPWYVLVVENEDGWFEFVPAEDEDGIVARS